MQGDATQAMPKRIVEERQRSRCLRGAPPPGLRSAGSLASLLARYIPQWVCSSLAPRESSLRTSSKTVKLFLGDLARVAC
jgi:hypothetical protein